MNEIIKISKNKVKRNKDLHVNLHVDLDIILRNFSLNPLFLQDKTHALKFTIPEELSYHGNWDARVRRVSRCVVSTLS